MKLHIGGETPREGWKILNISQKPGVDFIGDISNLDIFDDESFSEIYASHVLEHVPQARALDTLAGIYRTLKPTGKFYISVPDMDILCRVFIDPDASADQKLHVMRMIFGGQTDPNDFHNFGWNFIFLESFLNHAGFNNIVRVESFELFADTSEYKPYGFPISLNVIATK
jgi:predicted SAM-dependent methyltransferase